VAFALTEPQATAEDLIHVSFPIEKWEQDEDGDLLIRGVATDGTVDSDDQIVDSAWSAKALDAWISTGGNVRMSHDPRHPVGKGLQIELDKDGSGKHWVKSVIVDPLAQKLVRKGVLTAYSIGISRPVIKHDPTGRARGGVIVGGELAELSVVDRPSNKSSYLEIAKSAADGTCEFVGKMHATDEVIAKFSGSDLSKSADISDFTMPDEQDMSLTFTPGDLAKILKTKIIDQHYSELAAKAAAENVNPITSEDSEKGTNSVVDATPQPEILKDEAVEAVKDGVVEATKEADPEVTKDPEDIADMDASPGDKAAKPKKGKKGKKLPPWLDKPADTADNTGSDESSCKEEHVHSGKLCSGTPKSTSGATDAADMQEIPDTGDPQESPMPAGLKTPDTKAAGSNPEAAALLRFKAIGIDADLGKLHDLTCPAYDPEDVVKYHPYADFASLIDENLWMRKALDSACGPMGKAMEMTRIWEVVQVLKDGNPAELNDFRAEAHKAFRDANPGVSSYPSPGAMSPSGYNRPVISEGQAANSPGHEGPNTSPAVATSPAAVGSFNRPPLSAGQQSPSPSFMKGDGQVPPETGVPVNLTYLHIEKDKTRRAISMMHDHLSHQFPLGCPMVEQDAYRQPAARPVPQTAGLGKAVGAAEAEAAVSKAPEVPREVLDTIEKGVKRKLGKKVLAGKMTVDEARSKMGRMRAQKMQEWSVEEQLTKGAITREQALEALGFAPGMTKSAGPEIVKSEAVTQAPAFGPEIIKAAIAEAIAPLMTKIELQEATLTKAQGTIGEQQAKLEALADMPDPKTAAWTGLALNPLNKSARPAGVTQIAENAERTQAVKRQLNHVWRTSENAFERESAWAELSKYSTTE